jgi:glycosyltransferase involved in cell wall biosynthesis
MTKPTSTSNDGVLHLATARTWRGGEQQLVYLVRGLHALGIRQHVLCREGSELAQRLVHEPCTIACTSRRFTLAAALAREVEREKIAIVHTHDSHAHSAAVVAATMFGMKAPIVVSRRVDFPVSRSVTSRWKYRHASIKAYICVSAAVKAILAPSVQPDILYVVHDGVEPWSGDPAARAALRAELGLPNDALLVGNVSALADHKDHPTFLRTAMRVLQGRADVTFVLAGSGPEEVHIRALIDELGISRSVFLLGFRSYPRGIIAALDVFLMTSKTEGLGSVVLDAQMCGIPVVATKAGGIPEIVDDGRTGLLADIGDAETLARLVGQILGNAEERRALAAAGLARATYWDYHRMSGETAAVYSSVLNNG